MTNVLKTVFLFVGLALLVIWIGGLLGGRDGMPVASAFACLIIFGVYWFSGKIVLSMHRAEPLAENESPEIFEIVRGLAGKAGIPMPRLYVLPSASANAFATGRDTRHASIAMTHGIVGLLNEEELSGVLGHELSHILQRDILLSSIVAILAGALGMIVAAFRWSFFWGGERDEHERGHPLALILVFFIMPIAATLIQLTVFRSREYAADRRSAELCGNPLYLASALRKIDVVSGELPLRDAGPATAHLFITNPLPRKGWPVLFGTHPSIEKRVARLEAM